jgi:hypothetical protein
MWRLRRRTSARRDTPGTRSTAKPARKQKLDVTVPVTPAPKRAANGCNRFPASGRWLDRDAIAREIGLDFTNNAHRIFSPRGAAVTSADEASHVYVPGRRNRTWKLSGRTPKLTGCRSPGRQCHFPRRKLPGGACRVRPHERGPVCCGIPAAKDGGVVSALVTKLVTTMGKTAYL